MDTVLGRNTIVNWHYDINNLFRKQRQRQIVLNTTDGLF